MNDRVDRPAADPADALVHVSGHAVVLTRANIDTDVIINIDRCVNFKRGEYGPWALEALRFRADGTPDPACPLNTPTGASAVILVAAENFGCGSSREHAVWALRERGIRVIIAPSFGDIFFGNCFEDFILPIVLAPEVHARLAAAVRAEGRLSVDLETCLVRCSALEIPFQLDALRREMLMKGQRMIDIVLARLPQVRDFEAGVAAQRPWLAVEPAFRWE